MPLVCDSSSPSSSPSSSSASSSETTDEERRERQLYENLAACRIDYRLVAHRRVFTVAQSRALKDEVQGLDIRNLFVRDRKRRFFLLCLPAEQKLDLKALSTGASGEALGIAGRLSFANEEDLMRLLGVSSGAVNPFACTFDSQRETTLVLDRRIAESLHFNAHPMRNDRSIVLSGADFLRFLACLGREATLFDFATLSPTLLS